MERFPELSLFYRLFSPLNSEIICIFPYFCPYAESAREIRGIFVAEEMQSCGIGKLLLDYIKDKKVRLQLNVYQKNTRAISFYQREGFIIQCEGLDEATGEKEYTMLWKQK